VVSLIAPSYWRENECPVVIGRFIGQALCGEPITVFGEGDQSPCFTLVLDAVDAVPALMRTPAVDEESVNIGNEREVTIRQFAEMVLEATHSNSPIDYIDDHEVYPEGVRRHTAPHAERRETARIDPVLARHLLGGGYPRDGRSSRSAVGDGRGLNGSRVSCREMRRVPFAIRDLRLGT
jgi:UDP-glucose 4-epimerase